jgi:hypothetical protein
MGLPRTFVGFSSTDINYYRTMLMWKAHDHIDFDFCDVQLQNALNSTNEQYIKQRCRERLDMAGTYILLIGQDTRYKHQYVRWETEVAIEKGCRLIGVNIDNWRFMNPATCPPVFQHVDALFVPFSSRIVAHTIERFTPPQPSERTYRHWDDAIYRDNGYTLDGMTARLPPPANPYAH